MKVGRVAKVKSDRDLVDSGIKALVDALGYSGAARFLRHFSEGRATISSFKRNFSKGWTWKRSTRRQKTIIEPSSSVASLPLNDYRCLPRFRNSENVEAGMLEMPQQNSSNSHFDVLRIIKTWKFLQEARSQATNTALDNSLVRSRTYR